jgi:hypothetical protein
MSEKLNGRTASADERPFIRGELKSIDQMISRALARAANRETRLHLEDTRDQIARALDPRFAPVAPATPNPFSPFGISDDPFDPSNVERLGCWHDYAIRRGDR